MEKIGIQTSNNAILFLIAAVVVKRSRTFNCNCRKHPSILHQLQCHYDAAIKLNKLRVFLKAKTERIHVNQSNVS